MSTFSDITSSVFDLLFPPKCPVCGEPLTETEYFLCTGCRFRAPLTYLWREFDNQMIRRIEGLLPVSRASAFMWYIEGSGWQHLIHDFKYNDRWFYATRLGEWFGSELADSGFYSDIDLVVPVPLHWCKRLWRGYNQAEYAADGIASALGVKVDRHSVVRHINNPSQTHNTANERWNNVEGIFSVRKPEALRGKHLLLVDDVFTTGATMISFGNAIIEAAGIDEVQLSIATLACTRPKGY